MSFAKAVLSGTLVSDPEKRFTPNNHAVTNFTLAVATSDRGPRGTNGPSEPNLVKVTCWRNLAEAAVTDLAKGDHVVVEGKLMMNSFQTPDGVQKKLFEIEANSISKLPGEPTAIQGAPTGAGTYSSDIAESSAAYASRPAAAAPAKSAAGTGHFSSEDLLTEDDIPF